MKAMLAQSIDPKRLLDYASDDNWWFQQKVDGVRAVLVASSGQMHAYNRNGASLTKEVPFEVFTRMGPLTKSTTAERNVILDGEVVEYAYWLFDLPRLGTTVSERAPYEERYEALSLLYDSLTDGNPAQFLKLLPTARTTDEKLALAKDVLASGLEGVIVRDKRAPYIAGGRVPTLLKAKFVKHCDAVVMAVNLDGKQNMRLGVYDASGTLVSIGECTGLSGDGPKICTEELVGAVVEVRYLSVYSKRLYQPNMPRLRDDKAPHECTIDQFSTTDRRVLA